MPPDFVRRTTEMQPFFAIEMQPFLAMAVMERLAAALAKPR
jgi:hypothetical protein